MGLDCDYLLKLRLVVARVGELDLAKWWNTKGQLGPLGTAALRRGFPRTHYLAQARSVFAVATHRCREVFDAPGCVTLWWLPQAIEDEFDARWEYWIDHAEEWRSYFVQLESINNRDPSAVLRTLNLVTNKEVEAASKMRRSFEGKAVPLPGIFSADNSTIAILALGFARGEREALAVPYIRSAG